MLARSSTPGEHDSPAPIAIHPLAGSSHHPPPTKKRKKDHPGSSAPAATISSALDSEDQQGPESVLSADLSSRARLSISRHPVFVPISEGSSYHHTDQLALNRLGYRYVPAGVAPPTFRTIESEPTGYRVSWEDRSSFIRVTTDGLGLLGEKGYRGARCNAPVREGKWYMEVAIEKCSGDMLEPDQGEGAHVRLGWARREAPLNGPCGLDGYSYALRDKTGEKVTLSRPRPYGSPVRSGDVVGLYISLPLMRKPDPDDPVDPAHLKRERIPIEFKGQEYFEALEYPQSKEMIALMDYKSKTDTSAPPPLPSAKKGATVKNISDRGRGTGTPVSDSPTFRSLATLEGSQIAFFINGVTPGTAFRDIYDFRPLRQPESAHNKPEKRRREREGARGHRENSFDDGTLGYYPFISLFGNAEVRLNPGPDFAFPPPPDIDILLAEGPNSNRDSSSLRTWRPLCERYKEFMDEQWALDEIEREEFLKGLARRKDEEREEAKKDSERTRKREAAAARKRAKKDLVSISAAAASPTSIEVVHSPAPTQTGASTPAMHSRAPSELEDGEDSEAYVKVDGGDTQSTTCREDPAVRDFFRWTAGRPPSTQEEEEE